MKETYNLYHITDAMGRVEACFYIASSEEEAVEFWQEDNNSMGTDRSYIHSVTLVPTGDADRWPDDEIVNDFMMPMLDNHP